MTNFLLMGDEAGGSSLPFSLPTGTVTFLLTDIEASSRKWETDSGAMGPAVARHYEIVGDVVTRWGGVRPVEQGEGDSIVAAFSRASDAGEAALGVQRQLTDELGEHFGVRIALHTGDAQLRDEGNYFGNTVIRCARLRACGHGGQILVSHTTADLVADRLPDGASLLDLGSHRLKDLHRPERVFELCHPLLRRSGAFPPLRSLDTLRHNLPVQMTPLIGRERELVEVAAIVGRERLVTLTGTGGCGKSRLAAEVAAQVADRFSGGVWWCELAAYRDDGAVMDALGAALGVAQSPGRPLALEVVERLRTEGPTLAVLDNAEHLLDAVARATAELLAGVPDVRVIVTSREPLSVPGEVAWRVPSLAVPPLDAPAVVEQVEEFAAVGLFAERAARSRRAFVLTDDNVSAIAAICRRLDGIPLAIELAAARVRTLSPERIAAELDDRFRLLTGGSRTLLPRQQTLLASVAWSEALLDDQERAALRRLGVFVAGFSLDGAEAVLGSFADTDPYEVFDIVGRLVDKSLVALDEVTGRYRMLETIRSFALSRLLEANEGDAVRDAHLSWAIEFAEQRDRLFVRTAEWIDSVDVEAANLAAAFDWAHDRPEPRCALVAALGQFWLAGQRVDDAITFAFDTIERFAGDPPPSWHRAVAASMVLANALMVTQTAPHLEQALRLARDAGDVPSVVRLEVRAANERLIVEGPTDDALAEYHIRREQAAAIGDESMALGSVIVPYQLLVSGGRIEEARALEPFLPRTSRSVSHSAIASMHLGDFSHAARELRDAVDLARAVEVKQERFLVASQCLQLELLSGGEFIVAADPIDFADRIAFTGLWEMAHNHARLLRTIADGRWDDISSFADIVIPSYGADNLAVLLVPALVSTGHPDGRRRAEALAAAARARSLPRYEIEALLALAEFDASPEHAYEALSIAASHHLVLKQIDALELLAIDAAGTGDDARASRLKSAAAAARDQIGYRFLWPARGADLDPIRVEDAPVDTLDDAVAYALRGRGERRRPQFGWDALTPTELDVARRVAAGGTTPDVATQLHVSPSTVKTHLDHIYAKLGIRSRAELATEVALRS